LINLEDTDRLAVANHGIPVDAYYAISRAASAWLLVRDNATPTTHGSLLNGVSALATESQLFPPPWDRTCTALKPATTYGGFLTRPGQCSNLASLVDPEARLGMLLRTARDRDLRKRVEAVRARLKVTRAPRGETERQDRELAATTVFDFAWRARTRSNYGDPAMFYVGALGPVRNRAFAAAAREWTTATMFIFEALIAQRGHALLWDAAIHLVSRDRSGLAEQLLVPRMRTLGVMRDTTAA
jgi:hypothetical protein